MKKFKIDCTTSGLAFLILSLILLSSLTWPGDSVLAVSRAMQDPTACTNALQGRIAWNYDGNKKWASANLERLCRNSNSDQPARCFERVMHNGISWGGGTRWEWPNAVDLCEQSRDANATISCFQQKLGQGNHWSAAIAQCDERSLGVPTLGAPAVAPPEVSQVQSGRGVFRVTLNGFSVIKETRDDPLEGDGRRDEVFIVGEVWMFDRDGNSTLRNSLRGAVLGDNTNRPERVPAGSAQPGIFGGRAGGLQTGDSFPTNEPWRRATRGFGNPDRPPLKLWEGELVKGQNLALIMPTIWEWDSDRRSEVENSWNSSVEAWLASNPTFSFGAKGAAVDRITRWRRGTSVLSSFGVVTFAGQRSSIDGNRPIGITVEDNINGGNAWLNPMVLALTYDAAQAAVASSTTRGQGIVEVNILDPDGASYRLYLQVERVP